MDRPESKTQTITEPFLSNEILIYWGNHFDWKWKSSQFMSIYGNLLLYYCSTKQEKETKKRFESFGAKTLYFIQIDNNLWLGFVSPSIALCWPTLSYEWKTYSIYLSPQKLRSNEHKSRLAFNRQWISGKKPANNGQSGQH